MLPPIISTELLWRSRDEQNLIVLYTRLADITSGEIESINNKVILNAQLFDFESHFVDEKSTQPHTMCSAEKFQKLARELGINSDSTIVVYDSQGFYSAPRVWWMFKAMGHKNIQVLDGGLKGWIDDGYQVSSILNTREPKGNFESNYHNLSFVDSDWIKSHLSQSPEHTVVDARSAQRFYGQVPEPRAGVRSGRIPSAVNIPFQHVVHNGYLKSSYEIKTLFSQSGLKTESHLYFSCGSGVTACVLALAAYSAGFENLHVYDGSWTEWGGNHELPVEI